jgi:simple sugar transport system ATP-binding protein
VFEISERFTIFRSGQLIATGNTQDLDDKKFTYYMTGREFENVKFKPSFEADKPVLTVKNLAVPGAFEDVSFDLAPGQILGITGLLNSGRTELSLALFGLRKTSGGEILMKGRKVDINSPRDAIAAGIGLVPEDRLSEGLFLPQPISDNIVISEIDELAGALSVVDGKRRQAEVDKWVKDLAIATPNPDNACTTLSGGNQQRIVLAKWLACKPDVLILNGPTVGVDIGSKHDIHAILQRLANQGMAVIIISDDLPEILENCSDLLVMRAGRIVARLDPTTTDEALVLQHMM